MATLSKHFIVVATCDHTRLKEFQKALLPFGVTVQAFGNTRNAYWRLRQEWDTEAGPHDFQVRTTSFDQDVLRVVEGFRNGSCRHPVSQRLELHEVAHPGERPKSQAGRVLGDGLGPQVTTRANNADYRCRVCGCPGGLPCPSMVRLGTASGFAWAKNLEPKDIERAYIHPGRCRARLRAFIDTPKQTGEGSLQRIQK